METPHLHRDGAGSSEDPPAGTAPGEGSGFSPSPSIPTDETGPGQTSESSIHISYEDDSVSMFEQQHSQQVRELLRSLIRALKAKKMYPSNNPVLGRIMREFQDSMMDHLNELDDLTINVESDQFTYCGISVYKNESKRDSLAYRFHRDGITQLTILKGIARPELNAFLDVLALATEPSGAEEDLVTYLWEQEFTNIRYSYLAIEDLAEGMMDSADEGGEGDQEMREIPWPQGDEENYSGDLVIPGDDAEGSGERSDDWAQLIPIDTVTERCPQYLLEISEAELQELAEEVHLEHSRPLTETALEILTEVAEDETNPEQFSGLARAFAELVSLSVADADFARAAQVLATLNTLAVERGIDAKSFLPDGRDLVSQAAASIHHSPEADVSSLPEFLAHLGPSAIDPVCDLLSDRDFEALQPILAAGLSLLAGQDLTRMQRRLQNSTGQVARHILAAVANSPYPEADRVIALAAAHPEPRVRKDAISALVKRKALEKSESRKFIAKALEDKDPQVRGAALIALRDNPNEKIGVQILELIQGPRFESLGASERRTYFEVLLRSPGERIREQLRSWVMKPIWWPNHQQGDRRILAAWVLGRSYDQEDRQLLERGAKSFFPGVRAACRQALKDAVRISKSHPPPLSMGENS